MKDIVLSLQELRHWLNYEDNSDNSDGDDDDDMVKGA